MAQIIEVGTIPQENRHSYIFSAFDKLKIDDAVLLKVSHDPKPLYFQFLFERSGQFSWDKTALGDGSFEISITRIGEPSADQKTADVMGGCSCRKGTDDKPE